MFEKRGNGAEGGYVPMLTEEEVETFTRWHERAYQNLRSRGQIRMTVDGIELEIPGEVFAPTPMSDLLGTAVQNEVRESDRVLDMGTGSGINALLAARLTTIMQGANLPSSVVSLRAPSSLEERHRRDAAPSERLHENAVDVKFLKEIFPWQTKIRPGPAAVTTTVPTPKRAPRCT